MSSTEEKIGRLLALTETQAEDIRDIKNNMVTRREFDKRVGEHAEFDKRLLTLESHHNKGHVFRKIGDKALMSLVAILVTAAAIYIGIK